MSSGKTLEIWAEIVTELETGLKKGIYSSEQRNHVESFDIYESSGLPIARISHVLDGCWHLAVWPTESVCETLKLDALKELFELTKKKANKNSASPKIGIRKLINKLKGCK